MKILIFSDLHLHNHVYGSDIVTRPEYGMVNANSRLVDGRSILEQITVYIEANSVDEVVFCGDLFHTHGKMHASVLKAAYDGWERLTRALDKPWHAYAIVGNHDTSDKTLNTHAMHWLESLGVNVVDEPWHNGFNGLPRKLSLLPYTEDVDVITQFFADAVKKNDDAYAGQAGGTVCFLHAGVDGVPMKSGFVPGSAFNTDMVPAEGIQHVFSGHYHPHRRVTGKVTVVGTPLQLNWADEGDERGFIVYDTGTDKLEFHSLMAPKFVTMDFDEGRGYSDYDVMVHGNFVRVVNHDPTKQEEIRKEMMGAGARSVEFVVKPEQVDRLQPVSSDGLHLPDLVEEYEKQRQVTPERSKIGKELMK